MKGLRRILSSLNLAATLVLIGALCLMLNWVASRHYLRRDFSASKLMALSEKSRAVLRQLREPVSVVVFYQPAHPLYQFVRDLLKEYQQAGATLRIEYVDPEQDVARASELVQRFEIDRSNLIIIESGERHKYLSDTDLAEYDDRSAAMGSPPSIKTFRGEDALTSAILAVTQRSQPLVWVIGGHGEQSIDDADESGISDLKRRLEQENIQAQAATLIERAEIPPEVSGVFIPGPTRRFSDQELGALQTYLQRGGRLLALIDPMQQTGLDGLLSQWGVELGMDVVVDPALQLPFVAPTNLIITTYVRHPVVEHMERKRLLTMFPLTRSVAPSQARDGVKVTKLALTSLKGWGETTLTSATFRFDEGQDTKAPVSIAVAAEREGSPPTRLLIVGDSDFIANGQLGAAPGNLDFALGAFHWLIGQEQLIGIGPKALESIKLSLTGPQLGGILWSGLLVMPLTFVLLGVGVWLLRRQ